jgi:hypothetical protein
MDITDFYLGTPLEHMAYMQIHRNQFPKQTLDLFGLHDAKWWDGEYIIFEISKGIYGLTEAGILAQRRLYKHLAKHGYHLIEHSTGLFKHETKPTIFSLVVDDFGIQYIDDNDVEHLASALRELYNITMDWTGKKYLGLTINHNHEDATISISMPSYIAKVLDRFAIPREGPTQHSPAKYECVYGKEAQATEIDNTLPISLARQKEIQEVVGCLLYYSRAVDPTMLCDTNRLGSLQANPTEKAYDASQHLLRYAATYPVVETVFHASNMILRISSDASYLSETQGRSRVGGYFDLINSDIDPIRAPVNGAIHVISSVLSSVVASVAEAEYGRLFVNGQAGADIRQKLIGMGYPQPMTTIITDNKCAAGIANKSLKQLRTKSIDMKFHWIRDRTQKHEFQVVWQQGIDNTADYFTKVHPTAHHRLRRHLYVRTLSIGRHASTITPSRVNGVCCSQISNALSKPKSNSRGYYSKLKVVS